MLDVIRRNSQSWVVKVIFGAIILTFVFWGANSITSDSADVLAEVNGEPIYRNDLLRELGLELQNIQRINPGAGTLDNEQINMLGMQILGNMVRRELLAQEARKLGIGVSDQEFSHMVLGMREFQDASGRFSPEFYKDRIAAAGMKVSQFEKSVGTDILVSKLQDYITGAVNVSEAEARRMFDFEMEQRVVEYLHFQAADYRGLVNPDETAIIAYYSENKDAYAIPAKADVEYLNFDMNVLAAQSGIGDDDVKKYYEERKESFVEPASYHVRHILIQLPLSLDTTDEAVLEARKKIEAILAEYKAGKSFTDLAEQYSEDPGSKEQGGDLGWVERGYLVPSIDMLLPELQPGEVSEPVRTAYGFHLVQMVDAKPERQLSLAEAHDEILAQLREDAAYANMAKVMSDVEDKIITGAAFEALAQEYGISAKGTGLLELSALAPALGLEAGALDAAAGTPAGKMLPIIDTGRGFVVVRVNDFQPSFVPAMEDVKEKIVEAVKDLNSMRLASDAAAEVAAKIAAGSGELPAAFAGQVKESAPVTRFTGVMELGYAPDLTSAVFTALKGQWLDRVFTAGDGAVLLRVKDILPADASQWAELSAMYIDGLNNARKGELFNTYLAQLQKEAKIEIKTDRIVAR